MQTVHRAQNASCLEDYKSSHSQLTVIRQEETSNYYQEIYFVQPPSNQSECVLLLSLAQLASVLAESHVAQCCPLNFQSTLTLHVLLQGVLLLTCVLATPCPRKERNKEPVQSSSKESESIMNCC